MQSQVEIPPKSCKNLSNQAGDVTYTGRILPPWNPATRQAMLMVPDMSVPVLRADAQDQGSLGPAVCSSGTWEQ